MCFECFFRISLQGGRRASTQRYVVKSLQDHAQYQAEWTALLAPPQKAEKEKRMSLGFGSLEEIAGNEVRNGSNRKLTSLRAVKQV